MVKKFSGKNSQKCEAVRQAMRRVQRVGSERMPWATFYKEVSRLTGFNNVVTVRNWMQDKAMSLKPAWVDDPAKHTGANGPFNGIAFQDLDETNCVKVVGDVALSCLGKSTSIQLENGVTAKSRRFPASDYGTIEKAMEAALKHTQHVAARTSYYSDDPMAKKIREPPKEEGEKEEEEDGEGGWGSTHGRPRRARSAPLKMREAVSAGDVDAILGPDDNNDSDSSAGDVDAFLGPDDNNDSDSSDGARAPPAISEPPGFEGMSDQDLRDELVNKWGYAEILLKGPGGEGWTPRESLVGWLRKVRQKPLQQLKKELTSAEPDEGILVESPAAAKARALAAADLAAIREAYAREKEDAGSERAPSQMRKKSEERGCGGTRPEALNKLLEPLGDGTGRFGLACCVARGVIKFGSLRCMTQERLGDYVGRGKAVYERLGPKSKPHVDFVQRLAAEMKFKNLSRYFYGSMCHCHLDNVTSLLQRVEKKLSSAAPGAARTPGRARGAKMTGGGTKRQKVEKVEKVESPSATTSATDEDNDSTSDGIVDQAVYDRSPFGPGQLVLVPANAFGDDYADENPETLPGTLLSIKHVELDEAGEERRIWDVRYETGPFETDESFFVRRVSIGRGRRARGFERRSRRRRGHRAQEAAAAGHGVVTREESIFYHYDDQPQRSI